MSLKELDNLVRAGTLKADPGNQKEFTGLLDSGRKRLVDARLAGLSPDGQFTLAYEAAHALSLAAMRWHGYRPANKRFVVFQALEHTLGLRPEIWRVLDKAHQNRNLVEYEGYDVDYRLLADLFEATEMVLRAVEKLGPITETR